MELLKQLIDFILHIDKHLFELVARYETWTYLILFAIVFCETGLVATPILPGDSLLFAAGAIAAGGGLNITALLAVLFTAAVLGDTVNYSIGKFLGPKVFDRNYRFLKREYLERTREFYEKHGGKTIIIARFIPIIRTFAPFVAGVGTMQYRKFISYNIIGGLLWIILFTYAGYYFGNIPAVKKNFTLVVIGIIILSVMPPVIEVIRHKLKKR